MNTKYVIGTIHSGHTDKKELADVLEDIDPDQVLIELPEGFSKASVREREVVPDEMLFAYDWTRENGVSRACFDVDSGIIEDYFSEDYSEDSDEYQEFLDFQDKIIENHNWKDFNKDENLDLLDHPLEDTLFDKAVLKQREKDMLINIKEKIISEGDVAIVTGASHLQFFQKHLENAQLTIAN